MAKIKIGNIETVGKRLFEDGVYLAFKQGDRLFVVNKKRYKPLLKKQEKNDFIEHLIKRISNLNDHIEHLIEQIENEK